MIQLHPELTAALKADLLIASGYCPISNKYRMVSRLDRPDWLEYMAFLHTEGLRGTPEENLKEGMRWATGLGDGAADFYRRVHSGDTLEGLSEEVYRRVKAATPGNGWGGVNEYREKVEEPTS